MTSTTPLSRQAREWRRLYGPTDALPQDPCEGARALVLELARPAEWRPLAAVWKGVQADLGLPAPAIAANGVDGLQLWFSLAEPLDALPAQAFLDGLRLRYMADVPLHRISMVAGPMPKAAPAQHASDARWSVFVAADLAPMFEETPWLDCPPSDEGQADLLARLRSVPAALLAAAVARVQQAPRDCAEVDETPMKLSTGTATQTAARNFLLTVMNNEAAPLALRIEAAKALLGGGPR
jgi:hypothetical protein